MANHSESLLQQYRLQDHQANSLSMHRNEIVAQEYVNRSQMPEAMYYMKALTFADLMLILIAIFSQAPIDYENGLKHIAFTIMILSAITIVYLAVYGIRKQYLQPYWAALWIHYALALIVSVFIIAFRSSIACLWLLLSSAVIMTILEIWLKRSLVMLIFILIVNTPCVGILGQFVVRKDQNQPVHLNFGLFMSTNCICLVAFIFLMCHMKKWRELEYIQRLFLLSCSYLLVLAIVGCVAGSSDGISFPWPIFTIVNHVVYFGILRYFWKIKDPQYKICCNFSLINRNGKQNIESQQNKQKLYQVSLCLLSTQQEYIEHARQSVLGKPMSQCICCLSQQSTFCYDTCKHACICQNCIVGWLQKNVNKCPICRTQSMMMLRVERVDWREFNVIGKYRIGK